jgi:hypothetical protein
MKVGTSPPKPPPGEAKGKKLGLTTKLSQLEAAVPT